MGYRKTSAYTLRGPTQLPSLRIPRGLRVVERPLSWDPSAARFIVAQSAKSVPEGEAMLMVSSKG